MHLSTTSPAPIQELNNIVMALNQTSEQLIYVMEEQIQAIISSSPDKIQELTDRQSAMQGEYKKHERAFITELEKSMGGPEEKDKDSLRLGDLKLKYPEEQNQIDRWKVTLSQNAQRLQRKNQQLVDLLEFALQRNTRLMHSFYTLFNNKNDHYSPSGQKSAVSSGVAVNQEA